MLRKGWADRRIRRPDSVPVVVGVRVTEAAWTCDWSVEDQTDVEPAYCTCEEHSKDTNFSFGCVVTKPPSALSDCWLRRLSSDAGCPGVRLDAREPVNRMPWRWPRQPASRELRHF